MASEVEPSPAGRGSLDFARDDTKPWTFDGVVRLTRIGVTYLILTLVIGFAALNTGNNALYIGLTFLLGCLLLSGIASKGGLKHIELELTGIDEAWAGKAAEGMLRIKNRSRLWNVRDVVIVSDELAQPLLVPILQRRRSIDLDARFLFQKRGLIELRRLDLYTRYPFGFFLKKRRAPIHGEVVVYPRLLDEETARERFKPVTGEEIAANRPGPGTEIHSFREFVRGDSLRHVAWKKSASLGRWIMKQTDLDAARAVHVVVDPYKPRAVSDEAFEQMVSEAATFIRDAVARRLDVILALPRVTLRAQEAQSAAPLFRALALLEASHEPVHQTLDRNSVLFAVGRRDDAATA